MDQGAQEGNYCGWRNGGAKRSRGGGVHIYRQGLSIQTQETVIDALNKELAVATKDKNTLMAAASEGLFEEAIATVTRKINYKQDRLEFVKRKLLNDPGAKDAQKAASELTRELHVLTERKNDFIAAQKVYCISVD